MSKSTLIYVLASIVFCSVLGARIVAQDAGGNEQTVKPEPETQTKKLRVIDPEGKPIEGATVEVKHIRMEMMLEGRQLMFCLLYTSPSPRDKRQSRMPSSA